MSDDPPVRWSGLARDLTEVSDRLLPLVPVKCFVWRNGRAEAAFALPDGVNPPGLTPCAMLGGQRKTPESESGVSAGRRDQTGPT
jgi:hypothetical protein